MPNSNLLEIKNTDYLRKLALDLLEAEGFRVSLNTSSYASETNVIAEEFIVSHSGLSHKLRWFVQCQYSGGQAYIPAREIEEILSGFSKRSEDGLLLIVDTDISEDGLLILEEYVSASNTSKGIADQRDRVGRKHFIHLREILESRFSAGELRTLCFDLGVDYEGLPGDGKADKARELISFLERRDNIHSLVEIGRNMRPDISWEIESTTWAYKYRGLPKRKSLIQVWDQRQLENRLLRHPIIARKYGLSRDAARTLPFKGVNFKGKNILIISDTSAFAYQLFANLNRANSNVQMITVWQYGDPIRRELILKDMLDVSHDLVVFFLGDTFGFPIPDLMLEKLLKTAYAGKGIIFFPFFAWALNQGAYQILDKLIPVKLADEPPMDQLWLKASRILASGDFSWLNTEAFIENQPVVIKIDNRHPVLTGIEQDFSISHSFEFLTVKEGARCVVTDSVGTPLVVINEAVHTPIVYINSCMHNCLSRIQILSPYEMSSQFEKLINNSVLWCLGLDSA